MKKSRLRYLITYVSMLALLFGLFSPLLSSSDRVVAQSPDADLVRDPLRHPAVDNFFYFVMTDRFENGDPSNDRGGSSSDSALVHGFLPTNKGYYHGGDIQGLFDRLDYLQGLGVTAIWITPPFTNRWVQGNNTISGSSSGYHGYWQTDYTQIDPHFGSNDEMRALIAEVHRRGMKVFFDIITNHTADVIAYQGGSTAYRNKASYPYRDANGNVFDDVDYAGTGSFPDLDPAISFPYVPIFRTPADATVKVPEWLNNPIYYHNRGNSTFTGENSTYGDFSGLDDLFTEHPVVVQGMIDIHKNIITQFDVDGFRVDTVKHVNDEFWEAFVPAILEHAESLGKPDFFLFGEVYDSNAAYLSQFTTRLPWQSVLDFGFDAAAKSFAISRTATNNLRNFFENDDYYTDADSNAHFLVKFTGNHDMGRVGRNIITTSLTNIPVAHRVPRMQLITALMFFTRGAPVVYYGDEQGFTGDGGDQDARQDMFPSQVASYNDDVLIGTTARTSDSNFFTDHPLYMGFKELADVRAAHLALRQGAQIHRFSSATTTGGIYAFSRIDRDEQIEYVVALNSHTSNTITASVPTYSPSTVFTPVYPVGGASVTSASNGNLSVTLPPVSFIVYRAEAPIMVPDGTPGITISNPLPGTTLSTRIPVTANVTGTTYAEVTFAVSVNGGEFKVLGTDDNPPYRIFFDPASVEGGADLVFKAVVRDGKGALNSAEVNARTPVPHFGPIYALVHYNRPDGDYGSFTSSNFNDYWGLHLWGDIDESVTWDAPKRFLGKDDYGQFAWVRMSPGAQNIGLIVHRGDIKNILEDRYFNPLYTPEIWLKAGDPNIYTSQAAAQRSVTIHYRRTDNNYTGAGLQLWGDAVHPAEVTGANNLKAPSGISDYGAFWTVPIVDPSKPVQFAILNNGVRDPNADLSFIPRSQANAWIISGRTIVYSQRGAAQNFAVLHYHRPAGDYGNYASSNFNDFWGLHTWGGAADPGWTTPRRPVGSDTFGQIFQFNLNTNAESIGYIFHRGDTKDPGPDQFMVFGQHSYEIWQIQGSDVNYPHIRSIQTPGANNPLPAIQAVSNSGPVNEGGVVNVSVSASDPFGQPLVYQFDCANDGFFEIGPQVSSSAQCAYSDSGQYLAAVRVTDPLGGEAFSYTQVTVHEVAPSVSVSPDAQQVQYSDRINDIVITAVDVAADSLALAVSDLPTGLWLSEPSCQVADGLNTCHWTIGGTADLNPGQYPIVLQVSDDEGAFTDQAAYLTVAAEQAAIAFDPGNPTSQQVAAPGGNSGPVRLVFHIFEAQPDDPSDLAEPGNLAFAAASVQLQPFGGRGVINGSCQELVTGSGYDAVRTITCDYNNLPVDAYIVTVTVGGRFAAYGEDILTIYDPSLGFVTGGGTFFWPGTTDRTNFGFTMSYNKNGNNVKGNLLLIRHAAPGQLHRLKSSNLSSLAVGHDAVGGYDWASISGRATYQEPDKSNSAGNHTFLVFIEDRENEPDRFWIEVKDSSGQLIAALSMPRDNKTHAVSLSGGNIFVPHQAR